jgi:hypothetical protein
MLLCRQSSKMSAAQEKQALQIIVFIAEAAQSCDKQIE